MLFLDKLHASCWCEPSAMLALTDEVIE